VENFLKPVENPTLSVEIAVEKIYELFVKKTF